MKNPLIDTGEPRNVLGHIVSGAVASAIISGSVNYKKVKEKKITSKEAARDTVKIASQGAIATGAAIATANYVGQQGGLLKAMTALSIGMAGIYAVEVINDKLENKELAIANENVLIEEDNNE